MAFLFLVLEEEATIVLEYILYQELVTSQQFVNALVFLRLQQQEGQ